MTSGELEPFYVAEGVTAYSGDCLEVMSRMPAESVDAVITDPPYGIDMATSGWDRPSRLRGSGSDASRRDGVGVTFERWAEDWAEGCLRLLKPGGHLIAFGSPRMWHRLASGTENAGFEIRDQIAWLYATGYPKSRDISAAIDHHHGAVRPDRVTVAQHHGATYGLQHRVIKKGSPVTDDAHQWEGWGTGLRPAFEPIIVARKPFDSPVADNVLTHGTGGINLAAGTGTDRRWPANVALDHQLLPVLDAQSGSAPAGNVPSFPAFYYCPKASTAERPVADEVAHPTVKPLQLMRWLCRLFTPKDGTILDPFAGSGTTLEAGILENHPVIGIENESSYRDLIRIRVTRPHDPVQALLLAGSDLGLFESLAGQSN
jgi:DNA modification methylase